MAGFSDLTERTGEKAPTEPGETEERAEKSARGIVRRAALSAALAGISPIPLGGIAGVPALQAKMLVRLAKTFGRTLHWKEARNLAEIKKELRKQGYTTPLIADIHFTPNAALEAARIVEKVRINPGNISDRKKFEHIEYSDPEFYEYYENLVSKINDISATIF